MDDFALLSDEQLVEMAGEGNHDALDYLLNKYKNFVRVKCRPYFLIGADREDLIQEGMIGLYQAIRDYDPDKSSTFYRFAEICITRQIITAVKAATRQKHIPLNSYVSLSKPVFEEASEKTLFDTLSETKLANPEELMVHREDCAVLESRISEALSSLELKVLALYLRGESYQEIAEKLNREVKSVDNALQRVKRKLEKKLNAS